MWVNRCFGCLRKARGFQWCASAPCCAIGLAHSVYAEGARRAARSGVDPLLGIWLLYTHVEYLARAKVYALNYTDPEHEVLLVVTEDVSSRAVSSQHWAEHVLPYSCWAGNRTVRPSDRLRLVLA